MENYYVYAHQSLETGKCFYIGVGKGHRVIGGGDHRHDYWKDLVMKEGGFKFSILVNNITKRKALDLEKFFINQIDVNNLTNISICDNNGTFKKGFTPWNKNKNGVQEDYFTRKVIYKDIIYESVKEFIKINNIGKTTFYRWVKKEKVKYV